MSNNWVRLSLFIALLIITQTYARADSAQKSPAASTTPAPTATSAAQEAEKVSVDTIKEKYWARGDESELGVVQNRLYSKEHKFELGTYIGTVSSDPFLSVQNLGFSLGYHFSEYFSLHALYWHEFSNPSSALTTLTSETNGVGYSSNPATYFYGAEARASLIYGKLSVLGKAIIYYDLHIMGGLGDTHTETKATEPGVPNPPSIDNNANNLTGFLGIGQQIYLSKSLSLNLDYRAMTYDETQYQQNSATDFGQALPSRTNWSHVITLGVSVLIGGFK